MSEHTPASPATRSLVVAGFVALCAAIFGFLWVNSGGRLPVVSGGKYEVAVDLPEVANLVYFSDVMVAGVKVGKVSAVETRGSQARVTMELNDDIAPLHEGATIQVRSKSLVEESFLEITDGAGSTLPSGTTLPAGAGTPATHLADVLSSFDAPTRKHLRQVVRSSGLATADTRQSVEAAMVGLGRLGREGYDVVSALSAQSADLQDLTRSTTRVLAALSTQREQLRTLVANTDVVTQVTAGQEKDLRAVLAALPPLLSTAEGSSDDLTRLGAALTPVAENLGAAAPDLTAALVELPATSQALRATMPSLEAVLDRSPETLTRLPILGSDLQAIFPEAETVLADANPMLAYLAPYHRDLAGFFVNFAQTLAQGDANGHFLRVMPSFNEQSYKGYPLNTNIGPLDKYNPLPGPGSLQNPGPYRGTYTHVVRQ